MILSEIRADLYERLGYSSAPNADVITRIDRYINEAHREALTKKGCSRLRHAVMTFSSVANSPFAVLPQAVSRIITIQDRTARKLLYEIPIQQIRYMDPSLASIVSYPDYYAILNMQAGVALDPSDASDVLVDSTSASDTSTAYLEGVTTGGYPRTASITMTGTTAVSFGVTDWIQLNRFYLAAPAVGVVTLHEDASGGTELARISIGRQSSVYTRIHFYPTPSSAVTYYADVDRLIQPLSNAGDEPLLPDDFHWLLVCGALRKEYTRRENQVFAVAETARWRDGVSDLQVYARQMSGVATHNRPHRFSQLGPYYPAGS